MNKWMTAAQKLAEARVNEEITEKEFGTAVDEVIQDLMAMMGLKFKEEEEEED